MKTVHRIGLIFLFLYPAGFSAQQGGDTSYEKAKHLAQEGRDQEARAVCRNLLKKNASDIPVMLLLGRLYSWDQHYDSARIVLQRALDKHPENELILKAIINNEIWAGNSDKALEYANRGIGQHPQSEAFLVLKAKALLAKKDYTAALRAVDSALSINPRDTEALRMQENLKKEMRLNLVGIHYEHDAFDRNYSPWNSLSLYYARKTNLGPLVATVNYANRFSIGGYEYLLDFYPRLNRKTFLYLNAGVSGSPLFPQSRLGASLTRLLPWNVDVDAGFRGFSFQDGSPSLLLGTGSVEKYINRFLFTFKAFAGSETGGLFQFYQFRTRYYLQNTDNYFSITMGTGNSPDDQLDPLLLQYRTVTSRILNAEIHFALGKQYLARAGFGYESRINSPETFENRITLGVGVERMF